MPKKPLLHFRGNSRPFLPVSLPGLTVPYRFELPFFLPVSLVYVSQGLSQTLPPRRIGESKQPLAETLARATTGRGGRIRVHPVSMLHSLRSVLGIPAWVGSPSSQKGEQYV